MVIDLDTQPLEEAVWKRGYRSVAREAERNSQATRARLDRLR
jgi:hypothetical protein